MADVIATITGADALLVRFARLGAAAEQEAGREGFRLMEEIIGEAKRLAPVLDGVLRASGIAEPAVISGGQVLLRGGFGGPSSPYALAVHENPRSGKTGGFSPSGKKYRRWAKVGEWKYLETPFKRLAPSFVPRLRLALERLAEQIGRDAPVTEAQGAGFGGS